MYEYEIVLHPAIFYFNEVRMKQVRFMLRSSMGKNRSTYFFFTFPAVVLYTFFFILPMIVGIFYSFTDWNGVGKNYNFIGFKNYLALIKDQRILNSLLVNFNYVIVLIIVIPSIALLSALVLNSKIRYKTLFRSIYFFPAVLSMITVALIWNEILYRALPYIGEILNLELLKNNILSNKSTAIYGILLVNIWQGLSVPTVLYIAGLQTIPDNLYEAATIDGANALQKFRSITLPFLLPVMNVILVLNLRSGLTVFDYIKAMTDGGPGGATEAIGILIYNTGFAEIKFSYAITQSILLFMIIASISFIQFKITGKKEVE